MDQPYREKYGQMQLAMRHRHIPIGAAERDVWPSCMREALNKQGYETSLIEHIMERFAFTAERCRNQE